MYAEYVMNSEENINKKYPYTQHSFLMSDSSMLQYINDK